MNGALRLKCPQSLEAVVAGWARRIWPPGLHPVPKVDTVRFLPAEAAAIIGLTGMRIKLLP
jgi:hypothetical protein